ncbi:MAG: hypothetical protein ACOZIN_12475 [Myxococcota bacterium]
MRVAVLLISLIAAVAPAETLTIRRYTSDPGDGAAATLIAEHRFELRRLDMRTCDATSFAAELKEKRVSVTVTTEPFAPLKRKFDFDRGTIDGKPSMGHDGLPSMEYVQNNFGKAIVVSKISAIFSGVKKSVPPEHFIYMLNPQFAPAWPQKPPDECVATAYWADKEGLLFLQLYGSDGAGAYHTFFLFDAKTGFRGQYTNGCGYRGTFCAGSIDYLRKGSPGEKEYLSIELRPLSP